MSHQDSSFYLLPHTVVPESNCRQLSLLFPALHVLQVLEPSVIGACSSELVTRVPVLSDPDEIERVKMLLTEYRRVGELHEDLALMSTVVRDMVVQDFSESRFGIQAKVRGQSEPAPEETAILRREAALFLELAGDLDRKELEMGNSLSRVGALEDEFKEILGVGDSEELDGVLDAEAPPLSPGWGHFTYQLAKRIGYWWRLFSGCLPDRPVVFVALCRDVLEELMDPVRTAKERDGSSWTAPEFVLARLPSLESLNAAGMAALARRVRDSGVLGAYHSALAALVEEPMDAVRREAMQLAAHSLEELVESVYESNHWPLDPTVATTLTLVPETDWKDLWHRFDRTGCDVLGHEISARGSFIMIHLAPA